MSVCQHRPEPGGMWTSCLMACGGCACAEEVRADLANQPQPNHVAATAAAERTAQGWRRIYRRTA